MFVHDSGELETPQRSAPPLQDRHVQRTSRQFQPRAAASRRHRLARSVSNSLHSQRCFRFSIRGASPRTDLSNATEPCILTGLVNAFEGPTTSSQKPEVSASRRLARRRRPVSGEGLVDYHRTDIGSSRRGPRAAFAAREAKGAYIRHLDLNSFPDVADRLPLKRAKQLCGPRIKSANLWLGVDDHRVQSPCTGTATTTCCCNWKGASAACCCRPTPCPCSAFDGSSTTPGASHRTKWRRSVAAHPSSVRGPRSIAKRTWRTTALRCFSCDGDITAINRKASVPRGPRAGPGVVRARRYGTTPCASSPIRLPV